MASAAEEFGGDDGLAVLLSTSERCDLFFGGKKLDVAGGF